MATETEIERLVTTLTVNATGFESGMKTAQVATKATETAVKASGKSVQDFYKELKEFATTTHSSMEALGVEEWFKDLTREIKTASSAVGDLGPAVTAIVRPLESAGNSVSRWTDLYTKMRTSLGEKGLLESAKDTWIKVTTAIGTAVTSVIPMIKTAFASMATSVVASIKAVTAAMVASPAIFVVAAAAIVTAVTLIAGSVMKVQKNAEAAKKLVTEVEEASKKRRGATAEEFERNQEKADTLRGEEKTRFDQERLEKVQDQVREAVKSRQEAESRLKTLTTFSWTSQVADTLGFSQRVKVTTAAVEARKAEEAQAKEERDKLEEEIRVKPLRDIAALHKATDEDTMLVGLRGTDRELKKIETSLQRNIDLREFYVDGLGWDEEEEEVVKLDEAIAATTKELNRYKDALTDNKGAHAVQETKDKVDSLNKSLEDTIEQLKYTGNEWELYKAKSEALGRGAPMTQEQEDRVKTLLEDKKILQDRKKMKEESEQLTRKYRTPADKFGEEMSRLEEMNREGLLDEPTFGKAVEEITKEFNKTEKAIQAAKSAVEQFDGALVGTSESAKRLEKYRQQYEMMKNAADKPAVFVPERKETSEEKWAKEEFAPALNEAIKQYRNVFGEDKDFVGPEKDFMGPGRDDFVGPKPLGIESDFIGPTEDKTPEIVGVRPGQGMLDEQAKDVQNVASIVAGLTSLHTTLQGVWGTLQNIEDESESEEVDFGE